MLYYVALTLKKCETSVVVKVYLLNNIGDIFCLYLKQVFINFAKEQHSEERTSVKRTCGCLP